MNFIVRIYYRDDKDVQVILTDKEVKEFIKCVRNGEAFWTENEKSAFWTPQEALRYINVIEFDESKQQEPKESILKAEEVKENIEEKKDVAKDQ